MMKGILIPELGWVSTFYKRKYFPDWLKIMSLALKWIKNKSNPILWNFLKERKRGRQGQKVLGLGKHVPG